MDEIDDRTPAQWRAYDRWHWIVAALLGLVLLLMLALGYGPKAGCCNLLAPAAPAAKAPPAPTPPSLGDVVFGWQAERLILTGTVKDQASKSALANAAVAAHGKNVVDQLKVDAAGSAAPWMNNAAELVGWFKGKPNGSLRVSGTTVTLTGSVPTTADKTTRGEWARKFFGAGATIDNQLAVQVVKDSSACRKVVQSQIEFATGSARLTPAGRATLDKIAGCLKNIKLEVAGHTDNQGDPAANQQLSQARAQAVIDYLVGKGMKRTSLVAKGYGAAKPIADNNTALGRQKNRRIDFTAL